MVRDTIIENCFPLQHARVLTAAGFSMMNYSCKKWEKTPKRNLQHFPLVLSTFYNSPFLHFLRKTHDFGLSIISWVKNGLNFL